MDLYLLMVPSLIIGATIGAYRGGWRGCLLGLLLGLFGAFGWIAIVWLTREGTTLNPATPPPDETTAGVPHPSRSEGWGTDATEEAVNHVTVSHTHIWKLRRELHGARNAVIVLLIWTALILPIWMSASLGDLEHRKWIDAQRLMIRDHDQNLMGYVSAPGAERCRLVDAEGRVYWVSLELAAQNAGNAKLLLSSTEDGQPRLDLQDETGNSVWHVP